ncbi:LLM class flavin-dependent oxidoreductase [Bradyrhizobium tropiciagri]|uniref:LLM class flavin-dependent oxidoreductase n=1 Tax=Bradyrhizobium tropiciagri TaxID=312253 RepID=UPI000ABB545B|nr:LLM class flavin-dependent oxidoreductase [Bradyrhizobium tropiciagri]
MKLGFFTMPIHPLDKDWRQSLREDREAFLLADELGFTEAYVGEHVTDKAENITSSIAFIAWLAAATKQIKLGTGTINMPNTHPAAVAASVAMLDHMLDGRFIFGISLVDCCPTRKSLTISTLTATPCSSRQSIRSSTSGRANRLMIYKANIGMYPSKRL